MSSSDSDYDNSYAHRASLSTSFDQTYVCYSVTFLNRPELENGDKIIMPASALGRLVSLQIDYPMLFELSTTSRTSHCGVLEFVADEGMVYLPEWMMKNMGLEEGEVVKVKNAGLPKGTFIKLQPHSMDFLDVSNPKAVLEKSLRRFTCLTSGDTFMVCYNGRKYYINVTETRPGNAVCVVETDCEVEFATPLDYKEPEPVMDEVESSVQEQVEFRSFTGTGRRLDGKVVEVPVLSSPSAEKRAGSNSGLGGVASRRQAQGKVVFGGKNSSEKEAAKQETEKKEEPKFKPFTGKAHSLI